jgi:ethanolamine utilization protein EutP (predicted NTPase)
LHHLKYRSIKKASLGKLSVMILSGEAVHARRKKALVFQNFINIAVPSLPTKESKRYKAVLTTDKKQKLLQFRNYYFV